MCNGRSGYKLKLGLGLSSIDGGKSAHVSDVMTSGGDQPVKRVVRFRSGLSGAPASRDEQSRG